MCQQLKVLREELINADLNLEKIRQKLAETNLQNQEILANERCRRLETEEDMRLHSEVNHTFLFEFLQIIIVSLKLLNLQIKKVKNKNIVLGNKILER